MNCLMILLACVICHLISMNVRARELSKKKQKLSLPTLQWLGEIPYCTIIVNETESWGRKKKHVCNSFFLLDRVLTIVKLFDHASNAVSHFTSLSSAE